MGEHSFYTLTPWRNDAGIFMIMDFAWIADPTAWLGLGTLILLELVLGIDNLVFITFLTSKLPVSLRQRAFRVGLSLALCQRFLLLAGMAWIISLTKPWFTVFDHPFSVRDVIMLLGGAFLLFKSVMELHERLEGPLLATLGALKTPPFWHVVLQIIALDALFSFDSILTAVGMVKEVSIMMIAAAVAMGIMLLAARSLSRFVERNPTIIVLCLGLLLMIGLSLILDGLSLPVPKGYLYAAIGFALFVELFNQLVVRSRRRNLNPRSLRESTARAVLGLLGGASTEGEAQLAVAALAADSTGEKVFDQEERQMVARIILLGGRNARSIMTPWRKAQWIDVDAPESEILRAAAQATSSALPIYRKSTDEVLGVISLRDLLRQTSQHKPIRLAELAHPAPVVLEYTPVSDLWEAFHQHPAPLAVVLDEYGSAAGVVTPQDIMEALAGYVGGVALHSYSFLSPDGSFTLPGRMPVEDALSLLSIPTHSLEHEPESETLAGLLLEILGHIPHTGESTLWQGFHWEIAAMDGLRIDIIKITAQPQSS